ncbi:Ppx/GppA family phosphatase OS=Streptomyces tendae OX=1932 GN=F3L20_02065 PE=3 SV=1 [Streptomyces tendae]
MGDFGPGFSQPDHVVATLGRSLQAARPARGTPGSAEGLYVQRELKRESLEAWVPGWPG